MAKTAASKPSRDRLATPHQAPPSLLITLLLGACLFGGFGVFLYLLVS